MNLKQQIKLREWQKKAEKNWYSNNFKGIFSVATGGGKTIFAIKCIHHLFSNGLIDSVIVVVPTRTLIDQWISNFITLSDITIDEINSGYRKINKVNVLTNISAQKIDFQNFKMKYALVADECHRYTTDNNLKFLDYNYISTIGLTATIGNKDDYGVDQVLIPNLGNIIYEYSLKDAINDDVVENYEMVYLKTFLSEEEQSEYDEITEKINRLYPQLNQNIDGERKAKISKSLDLLSFKRKRVINNSEQRSLVASKVIFDNLKRKKILFCESIEQSERIKSICRANNLEVALYHSKMTKKERITSLHLFQSDYYHTLIGCKSLDEGFDVPDIDFGIIVSQTKTSRQRIQRLGRTIRKKDGKERPIIYTFYTTDDEYNQLYEEQFNNPNIKTKWIEVN